MPDDSKVPTDDATGEPSVTRRGALRALGAAGAALAVPSLVSCSRREPARTSGAASRHPRVKTNPYRLDPDTQALMAARLYERKVLERALAQRTNPGGDDPGDPVPVAVYNGIVVFDRFELEGGGLTFGQDFPRALLGFGLGSCQRIFEMCAGPGYIGYSLLAHGFCQALTLADINPLAVQSARRTARFNGITKMVNVHLSDNLKQIPDSEKWDLVVGNPPHFGRPSGFRRLIGDDLGWVLHRDFYLSVAKFMKPGGHIVLVENEDGSTVSDFAPMIAQGGGRLVASSRTLTLNGTPTGLYYVVSRW